MLLSNNKLNALQKRKIFHKENAHMHQTLTSRNPKINLKPSLERDKTIEVKKVKLALMTSRTKTQNLSSLKSNTSQNLYFSKRKSSIQNLKHNIKNLSPKKNISASELKYSSRIARNTFIKNKKSTKSYKPVKINNINL